MMQTNTQQTNNSVFGNHAFPLGKLWQPPTDLSKASFAIQPIAIRTQEQLREFVERNFGEIYRRTLPVVRNSEERAREIVQELYPRMLNMLAAYPDGIRQPWAAIRTVTRNLVIDGYRKTGTYRENLRRLYDVSEPRSLESDTDREEEKNTLAALVDDVLETLEPRQVQIISGLFLQGLLAKDIGEQLGLSESRISELKRAALERMRPYMLDRIARDCRDCFWSWGIVNNEGHRNIRN
jgi:RNA polymerase sigma factor (sigma-70 family)